MKNKKIQLKKIFILFSILFLSLIIINYVLMPWYVYSSEVKVPKVISLSSERALELLESSNLNPVIGDTAYDSKVPKGFILIQKPSAGEIVKEGRRIYLVLSGGKPLIKVPKLIGKTVTDTRFTLERLGLRIGSIFEIPSGSPRNTVLEQQFAEGVSVNKGAYVNITVSSGSETGSIAVPDLVGKSLGECEMILVELQLKIGKINYQPSFAILPNTIIDQYPSKGVLLNPGDGVDLFVTKNVEIKEEVSEETK